MQLIVGVDPMPAVDLKKGETTMRFTIEKIEDQVAAEDVAVSSVDNQD